MDDSKTKKSGHISNLLAVIFFTSLCYSNTLNVGFFYDDLSNITRNESIKNLQSPGGIIFGERPVGMLTFAINYALGGLNVTGYHIVNFLIHLVNCALIYCLLVTTFGMVMTGKKNESGAPKKTAFLATLLFAIHPVQTQAVTYIVQRTEILASTFMLLGLLMFIFSVTKPSKNFNRSVFFLPFLLYFLAFFTKEIAITLPALILLYDFLFLARLKLTNLKPRILVHVTLFSMCAIFTYFKLTAFQQVKGGSAGFVLKSISSKEYFLTQSQVIWTYLRLLFFPFNQNLDYDYPIFSSFLDIQFILSFGILLAIGSAAIIFIKRARMWESATVPIFFTAWFFIILSPTTSFIPILDVIYEHRLYLSSLTVWSLAIISLIDRLACPGFSTAKVLTGKSVLGFLLAFLISTTFARNRVWGDSIALWKDTVSKSPKKARPNNNLGDAYMDKGEYNEAIFWLKQSIQADPLYMESHYNLGLCYIKKREIFKALPYMEEVIKINKVLKTGHFGVSYNKTLDLMAHANLGNIYNVKGEYEKAISHFNSALVIDPSNPSTLFNLGITYKKNANLKEALAVFDKIVRMDPSDSDAQRNLSELQRRLGKRSLIHPK
ncbi:MAG: tetratricopeptide repeat protein [Nitrospinota bacterium]